MIQFLVHEKGDTVGVATGDLKGNEVAKGLYMDSQVPIEVEVLRTSPWATRSP